MGQARILPVETHWRVTILIAALLALVFFWPLLGVICFAAIMAFLFYPLYTRIARYLPVFFAATGTVFVSVVIVAVPIAVVLLVAIAQGATLAMNIAEELQLTVTNPSDYIIDDIAAQINGVTVPISSGQVQINAESIRSFFSETLPVIIRSVITIIVNFASSLPSTVAYMTVYIFLFAAFLVNGKMVVERLKVVSPFNDRMTKLYFTRVGSMIRASMLGQLLIAFVLAVLTAILFILINLGPYFFFLVIIMTLLNMIPLGSGVIVYPLAIIAILFGNVAGGFWVIVIYSFVICSLDNVMRPRLIPKNAQIAPALMTLAVFCGIFYFGILGVVYGPVIAIVLLTTFETYVEYRQYLMTKRIKEVPV